MARTRVFTLLAGEIEDLAIGFGNRLASGETLTGTPTVTVHEKTEAGPVYAGVTASSVGRNAGTLTDANGDTHEANEAVEFRLTAADDATEATYWIRAECATTEGRSLVDRFPLKLLGPPEA